MAIVIQCVLVSTWHLQAISSSMVNSLTSHHYNATAIRNADTVGAK